MAYDCIKDIISVVIDCDDQTDVVYLLDALGISLSKAAKQADERYITGKGLITAKVAQATDDVISELTRGTYPDCDVESYICDEDTWLTRVAKAVYYKTAALIFFDLAMNSSRYNEYVHYTGESGDALIQAAFYDSQYGSVLNMVRDTNNPIQLGMYQKEMQNLEQLKREISELCARDCVGSRYEITIP